MQIQWNDLVTGHADRLDGQQIDITGWLCPIAPAPRHDYVMLVPERPCCIGCLPANATLGVEVFAATPIPASSRKLRLTGHWRRLIDDPAGWRYQLRDARLAAEPTAAPLGRRRLLAAAPLLCLAAAAPNDTAAARQAISGIATVDMHSHAGALNPPRQHRNLKPFRPLAAPMRQGGMAVVCLAVVSDLPVHKVMSDGRIHPFRDPLPGELYAFSKLGFQRAHDLARDQGLALITDAASLHAARNTAPSAIIAAEGADFLDGLPDRIDEAYERWQLRHLQPVHYRVNELGDIQTEAPVHGGLTDAGAAVIRRCNQRGLVVDMAHATYETVKRAVSVTTKPLLLSHTSLTPRPRPRGRSISADHARLIAGTGGVIGVWPEAAVYRDLNSMARGMARLVDVVGIDHVGLGSDMLGLVGPSVLPDYDVLPDLVAALLATGFGPPEIQQLMGGNYARVFAASLG